MDLDSTRRNHKLAEKVIAEISRPQQLLYLPQMKSIDCENKNIRRDPAKALRLITRENQPTVITPLSFVVYINDYITSTGISFLFYAK
jgi:hypothetical protein